MGGRAANFWVPGLISVIVGSNLGDFLSHFVGWLGVILIIPLIVGSYMIVTPALAFVLAKAGIVPYERTRLYDKGVRRARGL